MKFLTHAMDGKLVELSPDESRPTHFVDTADMPPLHLPESCSAPPPGATGYDYLTARWLAR